MKTFKNNTVFKNNTGFCVYLLYVYVHMIWINLLLLDTYDQKA